MAGEFEYQLYLQSLKETLTQLRKATQKMEMDQHGIGFRTYQLYLAVTNGNYTWEQLGTTEEELNAIRKKFGLGVMEPVEKRPKPSIIINGAAVVKDLKGPNSKKNLKN
jgi:hypothetical protein